MRAMRRTGRDGFALLAVLWVLLIASALAAELHAGIRADQRVTANVRAAARARWAARAGLAQSIELLRSRLAVTAPTGMGWMSTDTLLIPVQRLDMDGVRVTASVADARARLNLNLATADELRALFTALGWEPGRAASRAAALARWRAAHLPPFQAAADTVTVRLRPPPGVFAAVEELRGVPGLTEAEYAEAAPHLTVASDGRINLNTASAPVLRTLPGIDPRGAAAIIARRTRRPLSTEYEVMEVLPGGGESRVAAEVLAGLAARGALAPREAEVRVSAAVPGSAVGARIRAVAVMAGGTRLPVVQVVER
jgi:type II secretory pathway component PulK